MLKCLLNAAHNGVNARFNSIFGTIEQKLKSDSPVNDLNRRAFFINFNG